VRSLADADEWYDGHHPVRLLIKRGDMDGAVQLLCALADAGQEHAAKHLARLLAKNGDLDGLRARAHAGDPGAARQLVDLLIKQGRGNEAEQVCRFGLNPDGSIAHA
jgi:hypothetical protein